MEQLGGIVPWKEAHDDSLEVFGKEVEHVDLYASMILYFNFIWKKIDLNSHSKCQASYTMKLVVSSTDIFKAIFQNIKTFADDVVIRFGPDGLYMQGMDGSMCCCFELKLPSAWFDSYEEVEPEFPIGINSGILQKILAVHKESQQITLTVTSESDTMEIAFTSKPDDEVKSKPLDAFFEIPLMEIEQDLIQFQPYESEVDLIIGSEKLSELVSRLKMFDERMRIQFTDETVVVEAKGVEGSMRSDITSEDVIEYAIGEGVSFDQEYSLEFLSMMGIFKKLNPEFAIQFHRERPMEAKYEFGDDGAFMKFFLAPKLSTDFDN